MKCPNCQTELTGQEKFCIKCGTKIPENMQPKAEEPKKEEVKQEPVAEEPKKEEVKAEQPVIVTPKPMSEEKPQESKEPVKEPLKIEPVKPEIKPEPDIKDPESMIVKTPVSAPPVFCIKCGAKMQPGAKFCTKCGTPVDQNQKPAGASSVVASTAKAPATPVQSAPVQNAPVQNAPAGEEKAKKGSKGIILIIVLAICALIVAILLALKATGVLSRITSGISQSTEEAPDNDNNEEDEETPGEDEEEPEEDPEVAEARRQEISDIMDEIDAAVEEGDKSELITDDYGTALDGYIKLASKYELADDVSKEAAEVFEKYAQQVRNSIALLDGQHVSSGLYIQSREYYDEILGYADAMTNAGIKFDDCGIGAESDALIEVYRGKYIYAINEITSRENWSRDEAWELMEDAASIVDEDGDRILFNEDDLDDPMRLRYIYSLAWKTRKDIETGIANGSMTYEDALDRIDSVLRDTDYNLMLLHDGIYYSDKAGIDSAPYMVAFNNEIEKMQEFDGVIVVLDPSKTDETHFEMNHFWIFNDISDGADPAYQVSFTNGTSATTRAWIRENIRVNR
ncbi:MAG: zinc-ribbon domain-containing protein [Lachnospiraceae bacterium]|nr:zinc-ribbon domain-containing protein [Lachnospiraceae bacterium]